MKLLKSLKATYVPARQTRITSHKSPRATFILSLLLGICTV